MGSINMNISIPALGGAQVSPDQIAEHRVRLISVYIIPGLSGVRGVAGMEERSPDTRCGDLVMVRSKLRGCHHTGLASSVHMYSTCTPGPRGDNAG